MAHNCPNNTPQHRANSACACTCVACLIGARTDLAADLEAMGKAFKEKVDKMTEDFKKALDEVAKKKG